MKPGINILTGAGLCAGLLISLVFAISIASADSVESFIRQLKDPRPEVTCQGGTRALRQLRQTYEGGSASH